MPMLRARSALGPVALAAVALVAACSSASKAGNGSPPSSTGGDPSGGMNSGSVNSSDAGSGTPGAGTGSLAVRVTTPPKPKGTMSLGQSTIASLTSLKYYISNIAICEGLETQGSGFNNMKNCLSIYQGPSTTTYAYDPSGDYSNLAAIARGSDSGFVDLMNETSRATLGASVKLSQQDAHAYNWGVITWVPVVKVTASVPMMDGTLWYTHDGVASKQMPQGFYVTTTSTPLATAPAEEAVVLSNNGGTWFRFENPFTVTASDIATGASFDLDLTFDPEGLITAGPDTGSGVIQEQSEGGASMNQISIPALDLTPVAHRSTAHAVREVYVADVSPGNFQLHLELYGIQGDANRTIYGVGARTFYTASTQSVSQFAKVTFLESKSDGLELQMWDHSAAVSAFQRAANVGDTATANLHCNAPPGGPSGGGGVVYPDCPNSGIVPVTFTLASIDSL